MPVTLIFLYDLMGVLQAFIPILLIIMYSYRTFCKILIAKILIGTPESEAFFFCQDSIVIIIFKSGRILLLLLSEHSLGCETCAGATVGCC